jgi:hypothetical protein
MKHSNIVRFMPKDGEFENAIERLSKPLDVDGLLQNIIVNVDKRTCYAIGIWESEDHLIKARPKMIDLLNSVRDMLEVISDDLGVTDPASGPIIFEKANTQSE